MNERMLPGNTSIYEGDSVEFICHTKIVALWFYQDVEMGNVKSSLIRFPSYNRLLMMNVPQDIEGMYRCKGMNEDGSAFTAEMYLHVIGEHDIMPQGPY